MIRTAWISGNREESYGMVSDKMARTLGIAGDLEECPRRLKEYRKAGLTPILYPAAAVSKRQRASAGVITVKESCIAAIRAAS